LVNKPKKLYQCPFCGNIPNEKLYFWEKVKKIGASVTVPVNGVPVTPGITIEKESNPKPEKYYDCNGCNLRYRDASKFDIKILLAHLKVKGRAIKSLKKYYSPHKISIRELLNNSVTGIVRKPRHLLSFLEDKLVKNRIYVGFNYMGIRTYGKFVKIREKDIEYYVLQSVGVP